MASRAILIAGCASGIRHATTEQLTATGEMVQATARRPEAVADREAKACKTRALPSAGEAKCARACTTS
jgi:NADP-dependent 3-hydroxy acid dehydrogenase YdfG